MSSNHPSRDPEFLSRLHDGDLTPGERAHFESHRAHCSECRRAAAEFEEALSLYRRSSPSPASPDLAARILRKLQAANQRRDPYGIVFGINLKWAGAFAVALVAMILGSSIVIRQQGPREEPASPAPKDAIGVRLESNVEQEALNKQTADLAASPPASGEKKEGPANRANPQRQAPEPPAAASPAEAEKRSLDLDKAQVASTGALESKVVQERGKIRAVPQPTTREESGGEGNVLASPALVMSEAVVLSPSIRITSLDGHGLPPDLLGPPPELPGELRGREYVIVVDIRGTVYDASLHVVRRKRADEKAVAKSDELQAAVPEALKLLRFKPTDRPRRLLLTVE